jgi:hypothetical protein
LFHTAAGSCENLAEAKPTRAEHNGEPILPSISSPLIARSFACGQRESREVPTQASAGKWTSGTNRTDFRATDQRLNPRRWSECERVTLENYCGSNLFPATKP